MKIAGAVAIVTGAGSGIGRAIALRLASDGASVVVDDNDEDAGRATVDLAARARGAAAFVRADVACEKDAGRLMSFADKMFGGVDILVNNAGCALPTPSFPDAPVDAWSRVLDVYLRGTMLCTQAALPLMRARGAGAIVNIASGAGIGFRAHDAPDYAAAKAGVVRLTASLAWLCERDNVRVNCVCPGWVNTPMSQRTIGAMTPAERSSVPRVLLQPEEIAAAAVRLIRSERFAGRVLLYYEGMRPRLISADSSR